MQLITTLNEASSIPIDDLKKVMQKDARVKQIFGSHLDLEEIRSPAEFVATIKFFLLNNRNVINFVEGRDYVRAVDKRTLKRLREIKAAQLTQRDIDDLQEFVSNLFREHNYVEKSGMSAGTRKDVLAWVNGNGGYFNLSSAARRELESLPNIRPSRPVLLYRGLLFSAADLRERKMYDGQLSVGDGLKFLRSVREGSRVVDLDWDRPSSWSTSKEVALRFAQFSSANSPFEATMNWLSNAKEKNKIHGELGFLISTLAQPEDVLIDVRRMATTAHMKHGDEGEFILKPGKYTCRVSTKFTKEKGEVDPIETAKLDDATGGAVEAVQQFAKTWATDVPWASLIDSDWRNLDVERELRTENIPNFTALARKSTKEAAIKVYDELRDFYQQHIDGLTDGQLETLVANSKVGPIVRWISDTRKMFNETAQHAAFKTADNPRGRTQKKHLSGEQQREAGWTPLADKLKDATKGGRFTDWAIASGISTLSKAFTGSSVSDLHKKKGAEQQEQIDAVLAAFYKTMNIEQPTDRTEAITKMRSAIMGAERTTQLINKIIELRTSLDEVAKPKSAETAHD